jgi:hypothetical protein
MDMIETGKYKVIVSGNVAVGQDIDHAMAAFAKLFQCNLEQAKIFFQGEPKILRKNLDETRAKVYLNAIEKIGLEAKLLPQQTVATSPAEGAADSAGVSGPTVVCPKCGAKQPPATDCNKCGVIMERFRQAQARIEESTRQPASHDVPQDTSRIDSEAKDSASAVGFGAAAVAALVGAFVWKLIAVTFGYELGIVAWGIGGAVGFAAAIFGSKGQAAGVVCGAMALVAILGGKYLAADSIQSSIAEAITAEELWDEGSSEIFQESKVDAYHYNQLSGDEESLRAFMVERGYSEAGSADDVTADEIAIFDEYEAPTLNWIAQNNPNAQEWQAHTIEAITDLSTLDLMTADLGLLDALFLFLGIGTAFQLGSGYRKSHS